MHLILRILFYRERCEKIPHFHSLSSNHPFVIPLQTAADLAHENGKYEAAKLLQSYEMVIGDVFK